MAIRNITSAQIIVAYGLEQGISVSDLLHGSGVSLAQLDDDESKIEDDQEFKILSNLSAYISDPFRAGVELGSRYHLSSYGIMGYALLSSSSLRKALDVGLRYLGLSYAFSDIYLISHKDDVGLGFRCEVPGDLGMMILVRDIWAVSVIQKELFDHTNFPVNLQFSMSPPNHIPLADLQVLLGGNIQFNEPENAFMGLGEILDLPLIKANEMTARICEEQCNQLLQEKQNWKPIAKQVKDNLVHLGLQASMDEIAQAMARTTRTLHRQLKLEGTSWRSVRDDVRMGIAEALLLKPMQLDEIAERLGFSGGANFTHSFKRCKGMTPSEFRLAQKNKMN
jgi:AraC-like DNA-binding protein